MSIDGHHWLGIAPCWSCERPFAFDPDRVQCVVIDPQTQRPVDMGGDPARGQREPLCPDCCILANAYRRLAGLELLSETDTSKEGP